MLRLFSKNKHHRIESLSGLLRQLARLELTRNPVKIVAITGTAGKTTTKEYVSLVLQKTFAVRSTSGNTNNRTGVPSTILKRPNIISVGLLLRALPAIFCNYLIRGVHCDFLVLEVAACNPGQIRKQVTAFTPYISIVTAVAPGHLETLGSLEAIAEEKSQIVSALPPEGVAILCADDPHVRDMQSLHRGKTLLFGFTETADVCMRVIRQSLDGIDAELVGSQGPISLSFPGVTNRYHLYGIMAAWCVGLATGVERDDMKAVLQKVQPRPNRGTLQIGLSNTLILDDTFNANPLSVKAALETFDSVAAERRRVVVLTDMLELGHESETQHYQTGLQVRPVADLFITCGDYAKDYLRGFADVTIGTDRREAEGILCRDLQHLESMLSDRLQAGDAILFKGSHGTNLYQLVDRATRRFSV